MRISDWSSDVCSSDLDLPGPARRRGSAGGSVRILRSGVPPWLAWQLLLPLAVFVAANFVLLQLGGDRWIAGPLYRSAERRVGEEYVSTCRSRGSPSH